MLASAKALDYHGRTRAILTFADITEQKQVEERFSAMFRVSPVPSSLTALDTGRFVNANRSFLELTGYNEAELLNRTGSRLGLWSDWETRARLQHSVQHPGFRELELELRTKAGETHTVLAFGDVLDEDVDLLLLIMCDVTERRRTEARLRRAMHEVMNDATSFSQQVIERFVNLKHGRERCGGAYERPERPGAAGARLPRAGPGQRPDRRRTRVNGSDRAELRLDDLRQVGRAYLRRGRRVGARTGFRR